MRAKALSRAWYTSLYDGQTRAPRPRARARPRVFSFFRFCLFFGKAKVCVVRGVRGALTPRNAVDRTIRAVCVVSAVYVSLAPGPPQSARAVESNPDVAVSAIAPRRRAAARRAKPR